MQSQLVRLIEIDLLCVKSWYEANLSVVKPTEICFCSNYNIKESQFLKHVKKTIYQIQDGRVEVSEEKAFLFVSNSIGIRLCLI